MRGLAPTTALWVEDETDLLLFPPLRAGWARKGEPVEVRISGQNERRVVFGALDLRTGQRLFHVREHQRSADFQLFLAALRQQSGKRDLALLLDEDSSHTAKGSLMQVDHLGVNTLWLPKRAPELNPMDTLWGQAKDLLLANRQYASIDEQAQRFVDYLQDLTDHEALSLAGVLSDGFWLRSVL